MVTYAKKEITTDVLVIGGGIAAVFAAKRAIDNNASVLLIDKGSVGRSGQTPFATGMAYFDEDAGDDRESWQKNMLECAENINNPAYLDVMMDYSKGVRDEMIEWGATKPGFGNVLRNKLMALNIDIIERTMITTLLEEGGVIAGAIGFKLDEEVAIVVHAKTVVLCTGAGAFKPNGFQVRSLSFDGDAMAYRIGAKISGKEFVDTHVANVETPAYCWGQWQAMWERAFGFMAGGPKYSEQGALDLSLCHMAHEGLYGGESSTGGKPKEEGEQENQEKPAENRDQPVGEQEEGQQAPEGEKQEGQTPEEQQQEGQAPEGQQQGGQPQEGQQQEGQPQEGGGGGGWGTNPICGASAGLGVHNCEGIFPADHQCGTTITGLYAAGDCLSSMLNGPIYRGVGGFGMAGSGSQGALAGEVAAKYSQSTELIDISDDTVEAAIINMFKPLNNEQGYSPGWVEHMMQGTLIPYYVLYIKNESRLKSALTNIEFFRDHFSEKLRATDLHDLRKAHEVKNMLLNAEMKLKASLFRTESRGNHYREDYPESNDQDWLAWVTMEKDTDGSMKLEKFLVKDF